MPRVRTHNRMVINPAAAADFIAGYKSLLLKIHGIVGATPSDRLLETLAVAREQIKLNPALVGEAAAALETEGEPIAPDVLRAIKTLRLRQWVFLRDTATRSIFIDAKRREAYGILGLTDRIRDIFGGSAVVFKGGVVEYCGRYVCDGIVANHVWLGPNYKKEFTSLLAELKKEGRMRLKTSDNP